MMWHYEQAKPILYLKEIFYSIYSRPLFICYGHQINNHSICVFHHMWHMVIYDLLLFVPP